MTGQYSIEIYNNRVHYFLHVERNITVIQGNSATGKTELIRLLTQYLNYGDSSGITVLCDKNCAVLDNAHWKEIIASSSQTIIFADEGCSFLGTTEFAQAVRGCDNYFVLITREKLPQLPYSILEIYGMRLGEDTRYHNAKRIYNELFQLYPFTEDRYTAGENSQQMDLILTEDSNSGRDFYAAVSKQPVQSTNGKSNVLAEIDQNAGKKILILVDGAAFGPEIGQVIEYIRDTGRRVDIYAPESFEYILLKADIIDHTSKVTEDTFLYADSCQYMSWEEFYTAYLEEKSQNTIYRYSKKKLNQNFLTAGNREKILNQLPQSVVDEITSNC